MSALTPTIHQHGRGAIQRFPLFGFIVLLVCPLGLVAQSAPAEKSQAREKALAHVRAQEYDPALEIFRRLAADDPGDFEARVWVARLTGWQGRHVEAEELYRGVLREDPENFEAELGLVDVLSWQGRYREAHERLGGLEPKHPGNLEVRLRRARLFRWEHRRPEAIEAYERILALDTANREAREALDALRAETRYRFEAGYFLEEFDFVRNTDGSFVELVYHDLSRLTLLGRFQYQNKFAENNTRFTLGLTRRFLTRTWVHAEASLAPTGEVIANQDYTLELTQGLHPRFSVGAAYRFLNFRGADVQALTALVNWDLHPDVHLLVRYVPARTRFDAPGRSVFNHNGWGRLVWDANSKLSPYILFAVGSESFAGLSAEQLGRFAAQTYGVGAEVQVTSRHGFRAGYYYQNRTQGRREQGVGASYFVRF